MTTAGAISKLIENNFAISIAGDRLKYRAPPGRTFTELRELLAAHRDAILAWMQSEPNPIVRLLPLSCAQQRLWFLQQLAPAAPMFNVVGAAELRGPIELSSLEESLAAVVARHEVLRTVFRSFEGVPVQCVRAAAPFAAVIESIAPANADAALESAIAEERRRGFDITRDTLFRARILRLAPDRSYLIFTSHHLTADMWSLAVALHDAQRLYSGRTALPPLAIQYGDFAQEQREWLRGHRAERELAYWRRALEGAKESAALAIDRIEPPSYGTEGELVRFVVPAAVVERLKSLARGERSTLFAVCLAVFEVWLHHLSGEDDSIAGIPTSGRARAELEAMVGCFINPLPFRLRLDGQLRFEEVFARVRAGLAKLYDHQEIPFEKLVDALAPARKADRTPFFQVVINYLNVPSATLQVPGLEIRMIENQPTTATHELALYLQESNDQLQAALLYRAGLFQRASVERAAQKLETLFARCAEDSTSKVDELRGAERREPGRARVRVPLTRLVKMEGSLPRIIEPAVAKVSLAAWARVNARELDEALDLHGAVLFRGFGVDREELFAELTATLIRERTAYVEGSSPRTRLAGGIYTSTEYPAAYPISLHNELSYAHVWPSRLVFGCLRAPETGGETPLADGRAVLRALDSSLVERFESRGVEYLRHLHGGRGAGLSWQAVFETEDRLAVERYCAAGNIELHWSSGGGLRTRQRRPALIHHPRTGDALWFNQADQWHPSNVGGEAAGALAADPPIDARYGDGSRFAESELDRVREVFAKTAVSFRWERGDVLLVDNMRVAHGRRPFTGERRILVAMGDTVGLADVEHRPR